MRSVIWFRWCGASPGLARGVLRTPGGVEVPRDHLRPAWYMILLICTGHCPAASWSKDTNITETTQASFVKNAAAPPDVQVTASAPISGASLASGSVSNLLMLSPQCLLLITLTMFLGEYQAHWSSSELESGFTFVIGPRACVASLSVISRHAPLPEASPAAARDCDDGGTASLAAGASREASDVTVALTVPAEESAGVEADEDAVPRLSLN